MKKDANKTLNPIAIWRAAAPLNRKKSSVAGFFSTEARLLTRVALASPPLNPIAPPPPYNM